MIKYILYTMATPNMKIRLLGMALLNQIENNDHSYAQNIESWNSRFEKAIVFNTINKKQ